MEGDNMSEDNMRVSVTALYSLVQPDTALYGLVQTCTAWYSLVQPCTALYSLVTFIIVL